MIIKNLANFLGKSLNEDEINGIKDFTSFDSMKNNPSVDFAVLNEFEDDCVYFRSGKSGDWRSHLTEEMSRKFDEMIKNNLKKDNLYLNEE